jgi:hypothetical protein
MEVITKNCYVYDRYNNEVQTQGDPARNIEVLFASSTLDIFRETVTYPFSDGKVIAENTVYVQYARPRDGGRITGFSGYQKVTYVSPKEQIVKYNKLFVSEDMKFFMFVIEQSIYHCFNCAGDKTALSKWWDFIWSTNESIK